MHALSSLLRSRGKRAAGRADKDVSVHTAVFFPTTTTTRSPACLKRHSNARGSESQPCHVEIYRQKLTIRSRVPTMSARSREYGVEQHGLSCWRVLLGREYRCVAGDCVYVRTTRESHDSSIRSDSWNRLAGQTRCGWAGHHKKRRPRRRGRRAARQEGVVRRM